LNERFGPKGLSIVGLTSEGKHETETWIEAKKVGYAYAYDKGGKLSRKLGVRGIPHAILIAPDGKVVWEGHPGQLTEKDIEAALVGSLPTPLFDLPASAKGVRAALQKHDYATAIAEAGKLSEADGGPALLGVIRAQVATRAKAIKDALAAGDFLTVQDLAMASKKELEGLPEAAEADAALGQLKADKESARVISGQKRIRAIQESSPAKKKDVEAAVAELGKIAKEFAGTYAERQAKDASAQIAATVRS
jgi:hypothetical protein